MGWSVPEGLGELLELLEATGELEDGVEGGDGCDDDLEGDLNERWDTSRGRKKGS